MGSLEREEMLESYGADIGKEENRTQQLKEWILVEGDRIVLAAGISILTFVLFYVLGLLDVIAFVNDDSITRLAGGLTAGLFSLVTVVVSVNQLILSQEFTGAGKAQERLEGVMDFRHELAETTGVPASPASPTALLELLIESIQYRAETLAHSVADHENDEARELVTQYTSRVQESSERMDETLEEAEFGSFEAVSAAIRYDNSWQLYAAEQLSSRYRDSLSEESLDTFDRLLEALRLFDVAREHFKTTYLQRELTQFSRLTLYAGVPAILSAIGLAFLYADWTGPAISVEYLPVVTPVLIAIMVFPLGLLVSYVLRTATVTRRTASIGPMLPQKDPSEGPFDVSAVEDSE